MADKKYKKPPRIEVKAEAMAWAEFLYKEYKREKRDELLNADKCQTIKEPTHHDEDYKQT